MKYFALSFLFFITATTGFSEENPSILAQAFPELKDVQPATPSSGWKPNLVEISSKSLRKKGNS